MTFFSPYIETDIAKIPRDIFMESCVVTFILSMPPKVLIPGT